MKLFSSAIVKLTLWYLAVLMSVSLAFSGVIFQLSSYELERPLPVNNQPILEYIYGPSGLDNAREERASEGRRHLLWNLTLLNLATLALGAAASYLFARRTLRPIEDVMKAQIRFTSDASHELNTPLAVIQAENEVALRNKKLSARESRALIKSNLEEVARLQQLTGRLLALSNNQSLKLAEVSIETVTIDAMNRNISLAQAKHIAIENKAPDFKVYGNAESLADILSILLDNAIKYSPEKSTIVIAATLERHLVTVEVIDQGPGITEHDARHIFERFYRSDTSRSKDNTEGYGLGLALARRLAQQNNAQLELAHSSKAGSTFSLKIPAL